MIVALELSVYECESQGRPTGNILMGISDRPPNQDEDADKMFYKQLTVDS